MQVFNQRRADGNEKCFITIESPAVDSAGLTLGGRAGRKMGGWRGGGREEWREGGGWNGDTLLQGGINN